MSSVHPVASAVTPSSASRSRVEARLAWAYVRRDRVLDAAGGAHAAGTERAGRFVERDGVLHPATGDGDEYRLVGISAYAGLPPRRRPAAFCPVCRERVWLKLGRRMRHHYQHTAGARCAAARPEGALHLAAKLHLAAGLELVREARIARRCHRASTDLAEPCRQTGVVDWLSGWDEVRVEHALPALRADLLLLRRGVPLAAIEIMHSHAVDGEKARRYRELGIGWIEVPARAVVAAHGPSWSPEQPIPVLHDSRLYPEVWRCERHARLQRAWLDHERNGVHRLAGRLVHLYRVDAGRTSGELRVERATVCMVERRENGEVVEAWLEREDTGTRIGFPVRDRDRARVRRRLHREFMQWVRWNRAQRGTAVDSPMRWLPAGELPGRGLDRLFPQRLRWDPHTGAYLGAPNLPAVAWPALPRAGTAESRPDPVLGYARCFWSALPARDRGPLLHGVVGACWVSLRERRWSREGTRGTRAELTVHLHTGRRWKRLPGSPHCVTVERAAGELPRWGDLLPEIARQIADAGESLRAGRVTVEALVHRVVGGGRPDGVPPRTESMARKEAR